VSDPTKPVKPAHYKVICVSIYTRDLERLDELVAECKRRGRTKTSRSELIREALLQCSADTFTAPKGGA
jgi:metal-responsive CopG/Arc/MetJ family transcriptional regulator